MELISRDAAIEEIHKYFMSELDKEETHMQDRWEVYANMPHVNELLTHNKQISIKIKSLPTAEVTLCHLDSPCEYQNADIAMPSAQTEQKVGKWILADLQIQAEIDNGNYCYNCSNCGKGDIHAKSAEVPYCWWCGARMRGEEG